MQFLAVTALLVAAAAAVPFNNHARNQPAFAYNNGTVTTPFPPSTTGTSGGCKPGAYQCSADLTGWEVCSTQGIFITAGDCGGAVCELDATSNSPFCV
jgi:hypothetical protein